MTLIDFINATNLHCAERSEIVRIFNEARAKRASETSEPNERAKRGEPNELGGLT